MAWESSSRASRCVCGGGSLCVPPPPVHPRCCFLSLLVFLFRHALLPLAVLSASRSSVWSFPLVLFCFFSLLVGFLSSFFFFSLPFSSCWFSLLCCTFLGALLPSNVDVFRLVARAGGGRAGLLLWRCIPTWVTAGAPHCQALKKPQRIVTVFTPSLARQKERGREHGFSCRASETQQKKGERRVASRACKLA